jgi:beta-N-acetylhexosaminidase
MSRPPRRRLVAVGCAVLSLAAVTACASSGTGHRSVADPRPRSTPQLAGPMQAAYQGLGDQRASRSTWSRPALGAVSDATEARTPQDLVWERVARMSLADKIGQLIVPQFDGTTAPTQLIDELHPGGVIYFGANLTSQEQTAALSAGIQKAAAAVAEPMLVMTDQEGGPVTRIPETAGTPGGLQFAGDAARARATALTSGRLLAQLGVNVDLAPDADVDTAGPGGVIGSRSFGSDPAVVSRLVTAQICGYHAGGVATAAKHFPGHGSTLTDSHLQTAVVHESVAQWQQTDLPPFEAAVRAHTDMILVGHLALPALDHTGVPATLTPALNSALLRGRLGYTGVVITDALNMGGVTSWGTPGQIAVRTVLAGSDMLLMPPDPEAAVRALTAAVDDHTISLGRLDASVDRILLLKQRLGLLGGSPSLAQCS